MCQDFTLVSLHGWSAQMDAVNVLRENILRLLSVRPGLTQTAIAQAAKLSVSGLNGFLRATGKPKPRLVGIQRLDPIAQALGVPVSELFTPGAWRRYDSLDTSIGVPPPDTESEYKHLEDPSSAGAYDPSIGHSVATRLDDLDTRLRILEEQVSAWQALESEPRPDPRRSSNGTSNRAAQKHSAKRRRRDRKAG